MPFVARRSLLLYCLLCGLGWSQIASPMPGGGPADPPALSPSSLSFTNAVGASSAPQIVTFSNPAATGLAYGPITTTTGFAATSTCGYPIAPGQSCTIAVSFTPAASGRVTGTLTVAGVLGGSLTVQLTGNGVAPPLPGFSPPGLNFGSEVIGGLSNTESIVFANSDAGPLTIGIVTASAGFSQQSTCLNSLAAGASCTITVFYGPTAAGRTNGTLTVNTSQGPMTASLAGSGAAPIGPADQSNQIIHTLAGGGPNALAATATGLSPSAIAYDPSGNLYVASGFRVYKVTPGGTIAVFAGNGTPGESGDGGPAAAAQLGAPAAIAADADGEVYIGDRFSSALREVTPEGDISTYGGCAGHCPGQLSALALDNSGNLFLGGLDEVVEINTSSGELSVIADGPPYAGQIVGLAPDNAGHLFILLPTQLDRMSLASGTSSAIVQVPAGQAFYAVAADAAGTVYIAARAQAPGPSWVYALPAGGGALTLVAGGGARPLPAAAGAAALAAQFNLIGALAVDPADHLSVASKSGVIGPGFITQLADDGTLQILAGNGSVNYAGDGAPATNAALTASDLAVDAAGNVYFPDGGTRVRELVSATGAISTIAGTGQYDARTGSTGDGGPATQATLDPSAVALDRSGNLLIGDHCSLREVTLATGEISTVAGGMSCDFSGDGGPATQAQLGAIGGILVDPQGNIYVSDQDHGLVRDIVHATGRISTVAGGGGGTAADFGDGGAATAATLLDPGQLAMDAAGNLYIADTENGRVRKVTAAIGIISTVAGGGTDPDTGDGGAAVNAAIVPLGVAVDAGGNLFIADNAANEIRRVDAATGIIQAVAGSLTPGFSGDGGPATQAHLYAPAEVALDATGNLIFSDSQSIRLREIAHATGLPYLLPGSLTFAAQSAGGASAAQTLSLTNTGASALAVAIAASGDFAETDTCGGTVASDASCAIAVTFTPTASGARTGAITVTDAASSSPQTAALSGTGTAPEATLGPASLTFASEAANTTSAAQTVTLSNGGSAALSLTGISISGANASDYAQTNACGASVAAGASCTVSVTFTPAATGAAAATLSVTDNAAGSPQAVALVGAGVNPDVAIAPPSGSSASATVSAGQTATFTLDLTPVRGVTGNFTVSCSGAPTAATCTPSPASVTLGGGTAATVAIAVATTARALAAPLPAPEFPNSPAPWLWLALAGLALLALAWRQPRAHRLLAGGAALALLGLALACGGGGDAGQRPIQPIPSGTPAGSYPLTVTISNGTLTNATTLTLTVN